ncbi:MAG: DNA alkylation repair protein [Rhodoluna sp.]
MLLELTQRLGKLGSPSRAEKSAHYFRTGPQKPGTKDIYRAVPVPEIRKLAKEFKELTMSELAKLAKSQFHDERLCALIILNQKYEKAKTDQERIELFEFWLKLLRANKINNWDLVDTSAPVMGKILSRHLGYNAAFLHSMAKAESIWERRAAILLTFALIRINKFGPTLAIARDLLNDKEDLIHKAVGWMLREVGNRDKQTLTLFLEKHRSKMPRTMLRYAIEKYSPKERAYFLGP